MRQYLRLSGIVTGSSRPPVDITDLDLTLGPIPGWKYLLDPDQITADGAVLDRVGGATTMPLDTRGTVTPPYPDTPFAGFGLFSGGKTAIALSDVDRRSVIPDLTFPAQVWSVFCHIRLTGTSTNAQELIAAAPGTTVASGEYGPRLGFSPDGTTARIWQRGSAGDVVGDQRLSHAPAASFIGRETNLLFTFSTSGGLSIFENGVLAERDAADVQALTQGFSSGQWRFFRGINADLGLTGILDVDLGLDKMAGFRSRLFEGLETHYG